MIVTANRLRSIGWIALLAVCTALVLVLAFRVNALRSQVHHTEQRIVALKQEKLYLETEFETRANQQQLKAWNDVEFGYVAPGAMQYLENERQLAVLSKPAAPDAPAPIRVATVDDSVIASAAFPQMVSPLSGKPLELQKAVARVTGNDAGEEERPRLTKLSHTVAAASLSERLGSIESSDPRDRPAKKAREREKADKSQPKKAEAKKAAAKRSDKPTVVVSAVKSGGAKAGTPKAKPAATAKGGTKVAVKAATGGVRSSR